jgi:hypothetical protein
MIFLTFNHFPKVEFFFKTAKKNYYSKKYNLRKNVNLA